MARKSFTIMNRGRDTASEGGGTGRRTAAGGAVPRPGGAEARPSARAGRRPEMQVRPIAVDVHNCRRCRKGPGRRKYRQWNSFQSGS